MSDEARVDSRLTDFLPVLLRLALGSAFLSAVASRLGIWGPHAGAPHDAFRGFVDYVRELNPWAPAPLLPALAVIVTALESIFGVALIAGIGTRRIAVAAGALLTFFAVAMTAFTGAKSAFDYSVWTAAASAFVLSTLPGASRFGIFTAARGERASASPATNAEAGR